MARKRKSQVEKVMNFLNAGKKLTAKTAISRFGIYRLAAVIHTLRSTFSMNITTDNKKGFASYSLTTK
jgi:hypothetical protein|tara:strand:- start:164 stop:367 length:204 start_codon:yes stop_codon:yes gene_type:complete